MKVLLLLLAIVASSQAHHNSRHIEEDDPAVVEKDVETVAKTEALDRPDSVQHHIYMPYPVMYRSAVAPQFQPQIQYVPVYPDPRFISFKFGTHSNLGLASLGANTVLDGTAGQFSVGAGAGLGTHYAQYGQYGVTGGKPTTSTTSNTDYSYLSRSAPPVAPAPYALPPFGYEIARHPQVPQGVPTLVPYYF